MIYFAVHEISTIGICTSVCSNLFHLNPVGAETADSRLELHEVDVALGEDLFRASHHEHEVAVLQTVGADQARVLATQSNGTWAQHDKYN